MTEFGVETAQSTIALLAAQPLRLTSYDVRLGHEVACLRLMAGRTEFRTIEADSLTVAIEPTDLLLIDSLHTHGHLLAELTQHAAQVRRWIAIHDTDAGTFGETGEDGGRGLRLAITEFLRSMPCFRIAAEYLNGHGLTLLRRSAAGAPVDAKRYTAATCGMPQNAAGGGGSIF